MQSRLIVKNFGPIKEVDLDLRNVNVFIGPQASGKSALAKLFTIFKAPRKFLKNGGSDNKISFLEALEEYNIASFLKQDTEISFESEIHLLSYSNSIFDYIPVLKNEIAEISASTDEFKKVNLIDFILKQKIQKLQEKYHSILPRWHEINIDDADDNKLDKFLSVINSATELEKYLSTQASIYIGAERSFINVIMDFSFNLLLNNVPIPKHLLLLGAELEKSNINEIDLSFLNDNLVYRRINGEGRIFINNIDSIKLLESASGIQSVIPILLAVLSQSNTSYQRSFVIEEPELNLFPNAQYELVKLLESKRDEAYHNDTGTIHTYTTHSPYILSAFNNLLYASKVWNKKGNPALAGNDPNIIIEMQKIIPSNSNIQPNIFTAYQIKNGKAESIFDREVGLIKDNYIDQATDEMTDDFDSLMNLMR